jgi:hypothetical protein
MQYGSWLAIRVLWFCEQRFPAFIGTELPIIFVGKIQPQIYIGGYGFSAWPNPFNAADLDLMRHVRPESAPGRICCDFR